MLGVVNPVLSYLFTRKPSTALMERKEKKLKKKTAKLERKMANLDLKAAKIDYAVTKRQYKSKRHEARRQRKLCKKVEKCSRRAASLAEQKKAQEAGTTSESTIIKMTEDYDGFPKTLPPAYEEIVQQPPSYEDVTAGTGSLYPVLM